MESLIHDLVGLGIPRNLAEEQIRLLQRGTQYANIHSSASIGDGILKLSDNEVSESIFCYDNRRSDVKVLKFVPASGAASRMFKGLIESRLSGKIDEDSQHFIDNIDKVAFYSQLADSDDATSILAEMLDEDKLDLDNLPKGSIPFHRYSDSVRTAFEEHLVEGVEYADSDNKVHIHFTVSAEHMEKVQKDMMVWAKAYGKLLGCEYVLQFSVQSPFTDTMPTSLDGEPLRDSEGRIRLRPGGHGSLIYNLNELEADIIFIKNVDNVVPDAHRKDTIRYKKALAGLLTQGRKEARGIISLLKADNPDCVQKAHSFLKKMGTDLENEQNREELIRLMNRPYRVCGMVRNQGEPGGGPFWVQEEGRKTLQVVESAQIDADNDEHVNMLRKGTHFNPVDLVCSLNDLYGMKQNLLDYVDMDAAFVTDKSIDGMDCKVVEWPGLWNGAMADWNTLFVEVPVSTFNPVKTINDLLRAMHQPSDS